MYFVTTKRDGYVLFCLTPSERAALGLTEKGVVRLLARARSTDDWSVLREWNAADYSPTDFLVAVHHRDEPRDPKQLLALLPERLRH